MSIGWFLSDIHIKGNADPNSKILVQFIESLGTKRSATHLFLLGDIFDLWIGPSSFFVEQYSDVVQSLIGLKKRNINLIYVEGNHDIHVGNFWRNHGFQVTNQDLRIKFNGLDIFLCHGDFINPKEVRYHDYMKWVRSPRGLHLVRMLPGKLWWVIGQKLSATSRFRSSRSAERVEQKVIQDFVDFSKVQFQKSPFDVIVAGHIHYQIDQEVQGSGCSFRAINLGSWFSEPHVLCLTQKEIYWEML